jgi:iron(III) transport system substrate-binding protein
MDQLSTYESLGDDEWKGRLCLRTSKKVYNQSLVAMLIAQHGESQTQAIVERWVNNLAAPPMSNDTKVMEAILAGQCDVGIVNTYYFGRLQRKDSNFPLALFWPNQSGVHVNVAGAGVLKYSPQPVKAKKLVEWLTSDNAQKQFAGINQEYPVSSRVKIDEQVASWGKFTNSLQPLTQAYLLQPLAVKLMDRAGYK